MKVIAANQTLKAKSICDNNCVFTLTVIERNKNFAKILFNGEIKKTKIYSDIEGNEYLMPEKYSMAPKFKAN
jgi:hypothetical protein